MLTEFEATAGNVQKLGQAGVSNINHFATTTAGGCHVPLPGGRIDGGSGLGQYRRITK